MERCVTGINGLDRVLGGGIPLTNLVLVKGGCGTGKTTLALEFLIRGAANGEKGFLVSTAESRDKLMSSVPRFEFFREEYIEDGTLQIVDLSEMLDEVEKFEDPLEEESFSRLCDALESKIEAEEFDRFALDSLTPLRYEVDSPRLIHHLLRRLSRILHINSCTGMLVSEEGTMSEIESIASDGVISMSNIDRNGDLLRTLQIVKMKGTDHSRGKYVMDLTSRGVLITPMLKEGLR